MSFSATSSCASSSFSSSPIDSSMVMCAMLPSTSYLAKYISISRSRPTVKRSISLFMEKFFSQSLFIVCFIVVGGQACVIVSSGIGQIRLMSLMGFA